MKFDVKKIVALVLTLALVVTTITFTAGNSLKANELDDQQLGSKSGTEELEVNKPETQGEASQKQDATKEDTEGTTEEESPIVQSQSLSLKASQQTEEQEPGRESDTNHKVKLHVKDGVDISVDGFTMMGVYFSHHGSFYQNLETKLEDLAGTHVIKDGNTVLGTITLTPHGNGNWKNSGNATDNYWLAGFAPYEPPTPPTPEEFTISVSASGLSIDYDGLTHSVTAVPSVVEGTTVYYSVDGGNTWTTTPPTIKNIGTVCVLVKAVNEKSSNKVAYGNYTMQIKPVKVVVKTKQRYEKQAGEPDPEFEFEVNGLVNGEPESLIEYRWKKVPYNGNYIITPYGEQHQGNYKVWYETDMLIIRGVTPLVITAKGYDKKYDGNSHGEAATVAKSNGGAAPAGTKIEYSLDNGETWSSDYPTVKDVKDSTPVLVRATCDDFETVYENYSLVVRPADVTVHADNVQNITYGEPMPTEFTAKVQGLVNGEPESLINYNFKVTPEGYAVGDYTVIPWGDEIQGNYNVSYKEDTFKIKPSKELTITATGYDNVYDGQSHQGAVTTSVVKRTTLTYSTDGGETWSPVEPMITNVGTINVIVRAENPNYETVEAEYVLNVTPKAVKVTAPTISKTFGEAIPATAEMQAEVEGTLDGDSIEYTLTREDGTAVGKYPITFVEPKAEQGNYVVEFVDGLLTIAHAGEIALTGTNYEGVYDGAEHSATVTSNIDGVTYEYSVDGKNWSTEKPAYKDFGKHPYKVRATKEGYTASKAIEVSVDISKKEISIVSGSATKTYDGSALKNSEVKVEGLADGEYLSIAAVGQQTEVGSSKNKVEYEFGKVDNFKGTPAKADNYKVTEITLGTLTVNKAPENTPVVTPSNNGGNGGNALVAQGNANGGVDMTQIATERTPLAGGLLDSHCCILHLLLMLVALIMLFWYTSDMKRRQRRIFELEEKIGSKE